MSRIVFTSVCLISFCHTYCQVKEDSVRQLNEVTVKAFASDRPSSEVPATIGSVKETDLNRFSNTSFLPVVNTIPGVRMEERSPGSYRFAIRGSSLRSPFGVRNVKFYWNGLPLTDASGNTYLNIVDFNSVNQMEILKGPGASLYGAGTGGVMLMQPTRTTAETRSLKYSLVGGSYGLFRFEAGGSVISTEKFLMDARLSWQQADGYRKQTRLKRFTTNIDWTNILSSKSFLTGTLLISSLNYETPGGLTLAQYNADPSQARPAAGAIPGAEQQKAAVNNATEYLGLNFDHQWNESWSSRIGAFGSITDFTNPSIRNYEIRKEYNWGGRTDTQYKFENTSIKGKVTFGAEYQSFYSTLTDYDNNQGVQGNVQTDDKLWSTLFLGFGQVDLELPKNFFLTLGASGNFVNYKLTRISVSPEVEQTRNFDPVFCPRIALLKKITPMLSVYGNISNGFSPPTLAEVRPSTAAFNNTLNAERGTSYEMGMKGTLFRQLDFNFALYNFELHDAIVIQRDASGADYFVNAGLTSQKGAEVMLSWFPRLTGDKVSHLKVWTSYTYNLYRFTTYINDGVNYSGNAITGVSPNILVGGADIRLKNGLYFNFTTNYTDKIPLNDANSEYASDYFLVGGRLGYVLSKKIPLEFFAGIDNALDQKYSLGNDLNAVGGRYYNAAAPRNYFGGVVYRLMTRTISN